MGSGGFGRVIADIAEQLEKYEKIVFLDDNDKSDDVVGLCKEYKDFADGNTEFYSAFGNNVLRLEWVERLQEESIAVATIIHPTAYVSSTAVIGQGTVLFPKCAVNSYTIIEDACIINMGALIDHNCKIGKGTHICLGAVVKADNPIPSGSKIEAGQVVEREKYK